MSALLILQCNRIDCEQEVEIEVDNALVSVFALNRSTAPTALRDASIVSRLRETLDEQADGWGYVRNGLDPVLRCPTHLAAGE